MTKTWQGRIETATDPLFERFTSSVEQDKRLAPYDVRASQAHARALAHAGVIGELDAQRIVRALGEIGREIEREELIWRDELEDVHTHVESRLREKVGDLADALHAGRSRNDQIATDLRLYTRDRTAEVLDALIDLRHALHGLAGRYADAVMPGYTHLQQAQPVIIAHPLLAHAGMLGRDWQRFRDAFKRINLCPLGSGALAGASFPLDRDFLADQLGFEGPIENSIDAVSDRDFLVEFVQDAAVCMAHLSRLSEDLILWSSTELGFVRLPDSFASGSSMMPQKKNPDVAELIRGKSALVAGDAAAALALLKGMPTGYNRDLQEDKTPLFHAADTLLASLRILAAMLPALEFDTIRTEAAISSFAMATDLADYLVLQGVPFREAHAVVGRLVARCIDEGRSLTDLTAEELRDASPRFESVPDLSPQASVRRKETSGSTHPESVAEQLQLLQASIDEQHVWMQTLQ